MAVATAMAFEKIVTISLWSSKEMLINLACITSLQPCCEVESRNNFSVNSLVFADSEKSLRFADTHFAEKSAAMAVAAQASP